jgi:2-iminobutanoate/2-iminopropanoate deaminase
MKHALLWFVVMVVAMGASRVLGDERAGVTYLNSGKVLPTDLPFSEAVRVGETLYLSGMIGVRPGTMALVEGGLAAEARQTMDNIRAVLESHGLDMSNVVKCTVMMADISEWGAFNPIYQSYFTAPYPARSAFGANGLALGARLEVECLAVHSTADKRASTSAAATHANGGITR